MELALGIIFLIGGIIFVLYRDPRLNNALYRTTLPSKSFDQYHRLLKTNTMLDKLDFNAKKKYISFEIDSKKHMLHFQTSRPILKSYLAIPTTSLIGFSLMAFGFSKVPEKYDLFDMVISILLLLLVAFLIIKNWNNIKGSLSKSFRAELKKQHESVVEYLRSENKSLYENN